MRTRLYDSRLNALLRSRNGYLTLAVGLLIVTIMLSSLCFFLSNRERIIIMPPVVDESFWLTHNDASPAYITKIMTLVTSLRFDVSPESVAHQHENLAHFIAPRFNNAFTTQLMEEKERIIKQHLSMVFYPVDLTINRQQSSLKLVGDLVSIVGNTALPAKRLTYDIHYEFHNGNFLIIDWQEVNAHG